MCCQVSKAQEEYEKAMAKIREQQAEEAGEGEDDEGEDGEDAEMADGEADGDEAAAGDAAPACTRGAGQPREGCAHGLARLGGNRLGSAIVCGLVGNSAAS